MWSYQLVTYHPEEFLKSIRKKREKLLTDKKLKFFLICLKSVLFFSKGMALPVFCHAHLWKEVYFQKKEKKKMRSSYQ